MRTLKKKIVLPLVMVMILSACAKNTGRGYTNYYPDCDQPLIEMDEYGSTGKNAAKGAMTGAFLGAATGFVVGLLTSGGNAARAGVNAAIGGGAGGLAGGVGGAMVTSDSRHNQLLAKYYDQIEGDISDLTLEQAAGTVALQCYQRKEAELPALEASGKITADAARKRRIAIDEGISRARALIGAPSPANPD